jgi:hypothetical protein
MFCDSFYFDRSPLEGENHMIFREIQFPFSLSDIIRPEYLKITEQAVDSYAGG